MNESKQFLTVSELREYLPENPSESTIYCWTSAKKIPYQKHGRRLIFVRSEIDKWLAMRIKSFNLNNGQ
jgi:excisionase family DNA binding protein